MDGVNEGVGVVTGGYLITADGQLEYNDTLLGGNVTTFCTSITGWDDLPDMAAASSDLAMYHGGRVGAYYARPRTITWTGVVHNMVSASFPATIAAIRSGFTINRSETQIPIYIRTHTTTLKCYGSVTKRSIPNDRIFGSARIADVSIQFYCPDPRRYSLTSSTLSTDFPAITSDGLDYPLVYPLDYGAAVTVGSMSFTTLGDAPVPAVYTITGPCSNPRVVNNTTGGHVEFGIVLGSGDSLVLDTSAGTAVLNGTVDRLYTRTVDSSPMLLLELEPGANSLFVTAADWASGAALTVSASDAAYF